MRIQATALMTVDEKQALEESAARHKTTLSVILRAGHRKFESMEPDEQAIWVESAKAEFRNNA